MSLFCKKNYPYDELFKFYPCNFPSCYFLRSELAEDLARRGIYEITIQSKIWEVAEYFRVAGDGTELYRNPEIRSQWIFLAPHKFDPARM